jgi:hypothetical protein
VVVLHAEVVHDEAEGDGVGGVAKEARDVGAFVII